jgi:hypothetical protein
MSELKNLGTLHLVRGSYLIIKSPDHDREFMLTLNDSGLLSLVAPPTDTKAAVCMARAYPSAVDGD